MRLPFRLKFEKRPHPLQGEIDELVSLVDAACSMVAGFEERLSKVTTMAETTRKKVYRAESEDVIPDNTDRPDPVPVAIRTGDPPPPGWGEQ
ncbi:hypothetical protein LCGC14_2771250 [marine sediment metagenome]|uniref:Uncharacterized protein n=1 Tax=marine sediment metagenome TaxID=412755 RepID=A0A0F8YW16_9ZZZZ